MNNKFRWLFRNTILFAIGEFSSKIIVFLLLPFYTSYLSTEEYGIVDLIQVTLNLAIPILTMSICESVLRFGLLDRYDKKKIFGVGVDLTLFACIVCFALLWLPLGITVADYRGYIFLAFVTQAFQMLFSYFARAIDDVREISISSIIATFLTAGTNILLIAVFRLGVIGYLTALVIGNAYRAAHLLVRCRLWRYYDRYKNPQLVKEMLIYSLPLIPNALFWWINSSIDKYCITLLTTVASVGIYSVAGKIPSILNVVTTVFNSAWRMSAVKERDKGDADRFYSEVYGVYSLLICLCTFGLTILSKFLGGFLYQRDFQEAWRVVPVLLLAFAVDSLNAFLGSLFAAEGKTSILFTTTAVGSVINIVLNLWLIPSMGVYGAGVATYISHIAVWITRMIVINKYVKLKANLSGTVLAYTVATISAAMIMLREQTIPYVALPGLVLIVLCYLPQLRPMAALICKKK